jgi:hypothetical protein
VSILKKIDSSGIRWFFPRTDTNILQRHIHLITDITYSRKFCFILVFFHQVISSSQQFKSTRQTFLTSGKSMNDSNV